jgi:peptide deformylase
MSLLPIVYLPDPILKTVSKPVENINSNILKLADDMLETMYNAPGIGLAAIQVGEPIRMIVMDVTKSETEKSPLIFINPEILAFSDDSSFYREGCLSIPDCYADVERPASIKVKYVDQANKIQEIEATGLLATCLQHEIDHLNGLLFIDHISKLKRDMLVKKFHKLMKKRHDVDLAI